MLQSASRGGGVPGPGWGGVPGLGGWCAWSGGGWGSAPGGGSALGEGVGIPACTEADTPPPSVDRQMLVKILPWPNFVAAGKNLEAHHVMTRTKFHDVQSYFPHDYATSFLSLSRNGVLPQLISAKFISKQMI